MVARWAIAPQRQDRGGAGISVPWDEGRNVARQLGEGGLRGEYAWQTHLRGLKWIRPKPSYIAGYMRGASVPI
jgi:hypothetical protein